MDNVIYNSLHYIVAYSSDITQCLDNKSKIIFIFADGSKLEEYNDSKKDCGSGEVGGSIFLDNKQLDKFKKQSIKDVRIYFVEGHHDFLSINTDMLNTAIQCMFK